MPPPPLTADPPTATSSTSPAVARSLGKERGVTHGMGKSWESLRKFGEIRGKSWDMLGNMVSRLEHDLQMAGLSTSMLVYRRVILKIGELQRSKKQVNEIHLQGKSSPESMIFTQFSGDMISPVNDPSNDSGDIISNHPQQ